MVAALDQAHLEPSQLDGMVSLLFPEGMQKRIAVKVIVSRGNEVLKVHKLGGGYARSSIHNASCS